MKRINFSLRTLLLAVLLIGSGGGLFWRWEPWVLESILHGHTEAVRTVALSPGGHRLVTASNDKTVRIWDMEKHCTVLVISGFSDSVLSARYSPDGLRIITYVLEGDREEWDAMTGVGLNTEIPQNNLFERRTAISPDGSRRIEYDWSQRDLELHAGNGSLIGILRGHTDYVLGAQFSPDGKYVLTNSGDKTAIVWDSETGKQLNVLAGHTAVVYTAKYSSDGKRIVTSGYEDPTARVWDAETGKSLAILGGHKKFIFDAIFSADNQTIITGGDEGTARIWNRRRPEMWWGIAVLPESWLILFSGILVVWSLRRDRRDRREAAIVSSPGRVSLQ